MSTSKQLPLGSTLYNGKYRIEEYLSSGGFGNTYLAVNTAFDEKVAIKELFIKGMCDRQQSSNEITISISENQRTFAAHQDKFRKEARRLRSLTNPHIVRVHDLFDENGTTYYVMDYIEGKSLSKLLKDAKQPLSEAEVYKMLPQILDALACVHKEGIWHLDLKPANIMVSNDGNVQLIDFGASKQVRNADGQSVSTSSAMAYTQGYAPSEQMEQKIEKFGAWTDIYSLGATLYTLLTNNQPPSPSDITENAESALPFPSTVSPFMRDLIFWMMKPNRLQRPQSIADINVFLKENSLKKKTESGASAASTAADTDTHNPVTLRPDRLLSGHDDGGDTLAAGKPSSGGKSVSASSRPSDNKLTNAPADDDETRLQTGVRLSSSNSSNPSAAVGASGAKPSTSSDSHTLRNVTLLVVIVAIIGAIVYFAVGKENEDSKWSEDTEEAYTVDVEEKVREFMEQWYWANQRGDADEVARIEREAGEWEATLSDEEKQIIESVAEEHLKKLVDDYGQINYQAAEEPAEYADTIAYDDYDIAELEAAAAELEAAAEEAAVEEAAEAF